jgi:hypothetical protein
MPRKAINRGWTEADDRALKLLVQNGTKTRAIARKLKQTLGATYQHASRLGVSLCAR